MGIKVRGHICIRRKAKDGTNGQSSFKSIVFIRTNDTPLTPTGGSFTTPVPTGWSDGVPTGTAKLWMSTRIFTSDGLPPQQSVWTTPRQATDTADIDFEFSAVKTSPGNPTSNPNNWHNTATESDIWMAVRKKQNGEWGSWEVAKIKGEDGKDGEDGDNGQSTFKSIVFKRQNGTPSTPTGGSYASSVPSGWSDGVPTGTTQLWMSTRIFTSDRKSPQQNAWTTPRAVSDEIDIDFEFSAVKTSPGNPTDNPSNWHNTATANDIWMAIRKFKNGSWGSWEISKIKGEDGKDGEDGDDGDDGAPGRTIRTTVWSSGNGKKYCAGDTLEDGVYPLDIVSDTPVAIGTLGVSFYRCKRTHTNAADNPIPLSNTTFWEELNTMRPVVTYLILAELIKAAFIDVDDLVTNSALITKLNASTAFINALTANSAFIDALVVKTLRTLDNSGKGVKVESNKIQAYDDSENKCVEISGDSIGTFTPTTTSKSIASETISGSVANIGPQTTGGLQELSHQQSGYTQGTSRSLGTLAARSIVSTPSISVTLTVKSNKANSGDDMGDAYFKVQLYSGSTLISEVQTITLNLRDTAANTTKSTTVTIPAASFMASGSTNLRMKVTCFTDSTIVQTFTYSASVAAYSASIAVTDLRTIMGNDGLRIQLTANAYFEVKITGANIYITMRNGVYGFRIGPSGFQKTTNGGSTWSTASL